MLVGGVLVAGLAIFLVGATAWRLDYQRPPHESLPLIHRDRRRWVWIHVWMVAGTVVTPAGLAGVAVILDKSTATVLAAMAATAYLAGTVCRLASLAFRLTVAPWAAEQAVARRRHPRRLRGLRPVVRSAVLRAHADGVRRLRGARHRLAVSDDLPTWLGWAGLGRGLAFAAGLLATRFAGPFNPLSGRSSRQRSAWSSCSSEAGVRRWRRTPRHGSSGVTHAFVLGQLGAVDRTVDQVGEGLHVGLRARLGVRVGGAGAVSICTCIRPISWLAST